MMHKWDRKSVVTTVLGLAGLFIAQAVAEDAKPSMDEKARKVWDRSIEVMYGKIAKTRSVKSIEFSGEMSMPMQGITASLVMLQSDGMFKVEMEIPGLGKMVEGYDGKHGWSFSELQGPALKSEKETLQAAQQGDLYGALHWQKYYETIRYGGKETIEDDTGKKRTTEVLLLLSKATGDEEKAYFDVDTGQQIRLDTHFLIPGGAKVPAKLLMSDFRDVGGIKMPFKVVQEIGPVKQILSMKEAKANVDVPKDAFNAPEEVQAIIERK